MKFAAVAGAMLASFAAAAPAGAKEGEKEAVLQAVNNLLDGWREADQAKTAAALHPDARLVTLRETDDGGHEVQVDTREHLVETVGKIKPGDWDDRLDHVSVDVHKSGLADVWAHYNFYIDGEHSHCGVVSFQLYKLGGKWSVVNFADTHIWDTQNAGVGDKCALE